MSDTSNRISPTTTTLADRDAKGPIDSSKPAVLKEPEIPYSSVDFATYMQVVNASSAAPQRDSDSLARVLAAPPADREGAGGG